MLGEFQSQIIAILIPMLAAVWLLQRIKITRYNKNKPRLSRWTLRTIAFIIVLGGTTLSWPRIVNNMSWLDPNIDYYIDGFLIGIASGIGTPFLWKLFVDVVAMFYPELAENLKVKYPKRANGLPADEREGTEVTLFGIINHDSDNDNDEKQSGK